MLDLLNTFEQMKDIKLLSVEVCEHEIESAAKSYENLSKFKKSKI